MTAIAITPRGFRSNEGRHKTLLRDHGLRPRYPRQDRPLTVDELTELVAGCRAAIVGLDDVSESVLATPGLDILVRFGAGADNVDLLAARRHGVKVATIPGATATSVAELALGLMLAAARRIVPMDRSVRRGSWERQTGFELSGRCLGLVGAGRIGREVAARAAALGMDVIAFDPFATESSLPLVTFEELLDRSASAVSSTPASRNPLVATPTSRGPAAALLCIRQRGAGKVPVASEEVHTHRHTAGYADSSFRRRPS